MRFFCSKILFLIFLIWGGIFSAGFVSAATYYVRADGTAANKSVATSSDSASTSMSAAIFNGETFSDGDVIVFSNKGGNFTNQVVLPSSGSGVGNEIEYKGESGYEPVWTSWDWKVHQGNIIIRDITVNSVTGSNFEFGDGTNTYTNVTTYNLSASNSSNQCFQHLDGVTVTHYNIYGSNASDEVISMHNDDSGVADPVVTIYGALIENSENGINWVGAPTFAIYDFVIRGCTSYSIQPDSSGGIHIFERGLVVEPAGKTDRRINCTYGTFNFKNVIFQNLTDGDYFLLLRSTLTAASVINCTFQGANGITTTGIFNQISVGVYKNNIFVDCGTQAFWGTTGTIDYNLFYNSGTAKGTNYQTGDPDLDSNGKIQNTSSAAYDTGIGPGSDSDIPTDDIDGQTRSGTTCDIGADEAITPIYRSVGPFGTSSLATDNSHANTITLSSGTANFSTALADNIGVGDVVIIDTGGTDQTIDSSDTLLFIHGRTDSTHYTLRTETGANPGSIAINDTYQIYRAHTSLSNAEAGVINSTLSGLSFSFTGGDRDLVTNNEQWNIACYANGTTADTTAVTINGWTTGEQNYIKVYTPTETSEAGVSQRHGGKWDNGKYILHPTAGQSLQSNIGYVRIDGLQLKSDDDDVMVAQTATGTFELEFSNNISR